MISNHYLDVAKFLWARCYEKDSIFQNAKSLPGIQTDNLNCTTYHSVQMSKFPNSNQELEDKLAVEEVEDSLSYNHRRSSYRCDLLVVRSRRLASCNHRRNNL